MSESDSEHEETKRAASTEWLLIQFVHISNIDWGCKITTQKEIQGIKKILI